MIAGAQPERSAGLLPTQMAWFLTEKKKIFIFRILFILVNLENISLQRRYQNIHCKDKMPKI
jgi:hypothetical protein